MTKMPTVCFDIYSIMYVRLKRYGGRKSLFDNFLIQRPLHCRSYDLTVSEPEKSSVFFNGINGFFVGELRHYSNLKHQ